MRIPFIPLLIIIVLNVATDLYIFRYLLSEVRNRLWSKIQFWSAAVLNLWLVVMLFLPVKESSETALLTLMWVIFVYLTIYTPKFIFVIFDGLSRLPHIWDKPRWRALSITGMVLAAITFVALWWGGLFNRYNLDVNEVDVYIPDLPERFDGFRIAQISDMHVGTYGDDTTFVTRIVDRINELKPDMVVFTGDIVNRRTAELLPFVNTLSRLHAPYGVYTILGNHDYGDYYEWPTEQARLDNNAELAELYDKMGWHLLANDHDMIKIDSDSIALIGVENVGDPPFHSYGDLTLAYPDPKDDVTKILLSHNPAHWVDNIANTDNNIALTLSGHTHAMQISVFGLSPCYFRYHTWGGLYHDQSGDRQLYVNIGTGTVGFPARVGATPEITLLTLRPAGSNQ